jgi:hypothetical protein
MNFFRQMLNALLARYFQGQGLFDELDFAAMKEGKPKALFAAWLALDDTGSEDAPVVEPCQGWRGRLRGVFVQPLAS